MYNISRVIFSISIKSLLAISTIVVLFLGSTSISSTNTNVNALDLSNLEIADDFGQSLDCVIVVVGCDGTGSVGSSGDTIIGSNNDNTDTDNNTNVGNPPVLGSITITKEVRCDSGGGDPSDEAVCAFAQASPNYPDPSDYQIMVTGNNPNPSSFAGSVSGTIVEIGAGEYTITEMEPSFDALRAELGGTVFNALEATGDCIPGPPSQNFTEATGTMTLDGSQTCNIINIVLINEAEVPP